MKKTVLTTSLATVTAMVLAGCGASSMPSPETLKQSSVQDFLEGQGFSWDDKSKLYEMHATKNRALDKEGDWTGNFKEFYDKRFKQYCISQGGKIESPDTWRNRVFLTKSDSFKTNTMITGKLIDNIKNWEKIAKLCTVNDTPLFGYSFSSKNMDVTSGGVVRDKFDGKAYKYDNLYKMAWDTGLDANIWWNIEASVVPINPKDYEEANLFISSYLKHNHFEEDKKASSSVTQTDKNYSTPSSGFRRY